LTSRGFAPTFAYMSQLTAFLRETWMLTAEMAPYLLLGFLIAGLLRVFFTEAWVQRHLGQRGFYQICKSVVIGIPLPLCSCGVIPVAAGIRRSGGQRGAVAAFTASTPQTGVDSIAASVGMLGWAFTGVRLLVAFVNGIVAGLVVERWGDGKKKDASAEEASEEGSCCANAEETGQSCCHDDSATESDSAHDAGKSFGRKLAEGFEFGLVTLPRDLAGALIVGLLIAGVISSLVPADFFEGFPGGLVGSYVALTVISLPLYVCSTGSIPMAYSFLQAGLSPGAVIIFLIGGPATNTATVSALWKMIGARGTIGYILSIIVTSWVFAFIIDLSGVSFLIRSEVEGHAMGPGLFQQAMGVVLVALLAYAYLWPKVKKRA
jgi:uncharacterized membrane protein YraQ (UPF0718 family)